MGVCATVKQLAEMIERRGKITRADHQIQLAILKLMPLYSTQGALDDWERAFQAMSSNRDTPDSQLIQEVFAFGCHNLYAAFDQNGTQGKWGKLEQSFRERGWKPSSPDNLDGW
jgi:hypothetical protein